MSVPSAEMIARACSVCPATRENFERFGKFDDKRVSDSIAQEAARLLAKLDAATSTGGGAARNGKAPRGLHVGPSATETDPLVIGRKLDVARMRREPPPEVVWRIHGFIPSGSLVMLYGEPGCGKSLFAACLGTAAVHGDSQAGITTTKGPVLYVDAENGEHEIHRRVRSLDVPDSDFHLRDGEGVDIVSAGEKLRADIENTGARLVVLDSLRSLAPKLDENDPKSCEGTLASLRRIAHETGVSILVIHHSRKSNGEYRGSTALLAALDAAFSLTRVEGDPDKVRRRLTCRKMRAAPEPEDRWLSIVAEGDSVLVESAEPFDGVTTVPTVVSELRERVLDKLADGEPSRLADVAQALGRAPRDGSIRRALGSLVAEGSVLRDDHKLYRLASPKGANRLDPPGVGTLAPFGNAPPQTALESGKGGVGKGANGGATSTSLAPQNSGGDPRGLAGEKVLV